MTGVFTIGCHLSIAKGFAAAARDAVSIGANTFQFFTRNPRGGKAKAIDPADMAACRLIADEQGITRVFAREVLADDLLRMEQIPGQLYNMHPGSHVGQGPEAGIAMIAEAINSALDPAQTTTLLLETMAGKGTEIGRSFEELRDIIERIERIELQDHVGVCLDTCHVWDAGYDLAHLDDVLEQFDRVLGIGRLRAIHLNDSKNPLASHKDRHEQIGKGRIGLGSLMAVVMHPQLKDLPFFLETPHDSLSGYAEEISLLKKARLDAFGAV